MDDIAKEYVISFYNKNLDIFGDRPESLKWTEKGQLQHYISLLDIADSIEGKKVLDFGCGKGDLYQFLRERNIAVDYTGFDINERLIALAKKKFPEGRFRVFDMEEDSLDEDFDYIFLCGVFNLRVDGIDKTTKQTLKKLFGHCRIALAFNALSAYNPEKDFDLNYVYPEDIFRFVVKNLSPYVVLRHDRILYDFMVFIYKEINH